MKAFAHFCTITKHKKLVLKECFRVGLYKQGLLHDMSKYSWTEFRVGCRYYQGTRSPNNAEREEKGYSSAWLHHKGRNKHHYEYWIDYSLEGPNLLAGMKMPVRYVVEMFLDRIAASKVYLGDAYTSDAPLAYYENGRAIIRKTASYACGRRRGNYLQIYQERNIKKIRRGSVGSSEAIYCASWRDGLEQEKTGTGTKGYSLK